ncbi:MAG: hypothetical protein QOE82_1321 [Thermoanaerobaculia bacterium]|nr:hypothetical protein [Thermoanaerobaculia bacterium]
MPDLKFYLFHSHASIVDQFADALDGIESDGFAVIDPVGVPCCIDGGYPEGRYAVLTFDDGREDRNPAIVDVLRTMKLRALAFLYVLDPAMETVRIDWSFWRQHADVFEIGAHSLTHSRVARSNGSAVSGAERVLSYRNARSGDDFCPGLVTPAWDQLYERTETAAETRMRIESEVYLSKKMIERNLGVPCRFFAYPWGIYTPGLIDIVREAGFEAAFSVGRTDGTRWSIPRIDMDSDQPRHQTRAFSINHCRVLHDGP